MTQNSIIETELEKKAQELNVPVETLREMFLGLSQVQRDEELKSYASKTGKQADKEATPLALLPFEDNTVITLDKIIYLDDIDKENGLPGASEAMRALNSEWVETLEVAYRNTPQDMPSVDMVRTTWGFLNVDGRHRLTAQDNNLKAKYASDDGKMTPEQRKAYNEAKASYVVNYKPIECATLNDAIMYAFRANLKNGLNMSKSNRARFGLWLQRQAEKANLHMTDQEAADEAGTVKSNIINMRKRVAVKVATEILKAEQEGKDRKTVKMPADWALMPADHMKKVNSEIKAIKADVQEDKPLERAMEAFISALTNLYSLLDVPESLGHELVAYMIGDVNENTYQAIDCFKEASELALDEADELMSHEEAMAEVPDGQPMAEVND